MLAQREYVIYLLESSHSGDSRHWPEVSDIPAITPFSKRFPDRALAEAMRITKRTPYQTLTI
jgi:hypothetical protein